MNTTQLRTVLVAALLVGGLAQTFAETVTRSTVSFTDPDKFTDFRDGIIGTTRGQAQYIAKLREFIETNAGRLLPEGQQLTITFTDIDLAGTFSAEAPKTHDQRIVKDYFAIPRMKFTYSVTDSNGAVVKQGTEDISENRYTRVTVNIADAMLVYDLELLRTWMDRTLK